MFTSTTRRYPDGTPRTKHVTTNLIVEVDDDAGTATGRSYFTVLQAVPGLPLQPIVAGRYHDRFVRDGVGVAVRRAAVLHRPGRRREPAPTGPPALDRLTPGTGSDPDT